MTYPIREIEHRLLAVLRAGPHGEPLSLNAVINALARDGSGNPLSDGTLRRGLRALESRGKVVSAPHVWRYRHYSGHRAETRKGTGWSVAKSESGTTP
jgi:hypothetical protein